MLLALLQALFNALAMMTLTYFLFTKPMNQDYIMMVCLHHSSLLVRAHSGFAFSTRSNWIQQKSFCIPWIEIDLPLEYSLLFLSRCFALDFHPSVSCNPRRSFRLPWWWQELPLPKWFNTHSLVPYSVCR